MVSYYIKYTATSRNWFSTSNLTWNKINWSINIRACVLSRGLGVWWNCLDTCPYCYVMSKARCSKWLVHCPVQFVFVSESCQRVRSRKLKWHTKSSSRWQQHMDAQDSLEQQDLIVLRFVSCQKSNIHMDERKHWALIFPFCIVTFNNVRSK